MGLRRPRVPVARAASVPVGPGAARHLRGRAVTAFALASIALALIEICSNAAGNQYGFDFHGGMWRAGRDVLDGLSPYPVPRISALLAQSNAFIPPPPLALLSIPLSVLPFTLAVVLLNVVCAAGLTASLLVLGVRDWRVFALGLCSFPFVASLVLGQPDGVFALVAALSWRHRGSGRGAMAVGALIALKLFAWPLILWLLATRRARSAAIATLSTLVILAGTWACIGFRGLRDYSRLLTADSRAFEQNSHSVVSAAMRLGASQRVGLVLAIVVALSLVLIVVRIAHGGDLAWFAAAIAAGLLTSPILWSHYLVLMLVPLAIARPRADGAWLLTLALYLSPVEPPRTWQVLGVLALTGLIATLSADEPRTRILPVPRAAGRRPWGRPLDPFRRKVTFAQTAGQG